MDNNRTSYLKTASERQRQTKYQIFGSPKSSLPFDPLMFNKLLDGSKSATRMSHGASLKSNTFIQLLKDCKSEKRFFKSQKPQKQLLQCKSFTVDGQQEPPKKKSSSKLRRSNRSAKDLLTAREQINQRSHCSVLIISGPKQVQFSVRATSIENLVSTLAVQTPHASNEEVVGYRTLNNNLKLDYYLTCREADAGFLNGSKIILRPIFRVRQPVIGLSSFEIVQSIGSGGFSSVYLCRFKEDGKFYAMKVIDKAFIVKNKKKKIVMNQRNIMVQLSHPLLAKLHFSFETKNELIFVLEYYPGGELFGLVKHYRKMSEDIAKFYMIEILLGLQQIHQAGIAYRDFKPENILIDRDGHVHIADFGLAKPDIKDCKARAYSFCGSPEYMPPEMIAKKGHSLPVDFYCLGAMFYELVTGLPPFYDKDPENIYKATLSEPVIFPKHAQDLSTSLKLLLQGLLCKDQHKRMGSMFGVKEVLAHPFFGKVNSSDYESKRAKPPLTFLNLEDLTFNQEEMKGENDLLMKKIIKSQCASSEAFIRVMANFYYDSRESAKDTKDELFGSPSLQLIQVQTSRDAQYRLKNALSHKKLASRDGMKHKQKANEREATLADSQNCFQRHFHQIDNLMR